MLWLVNGNAAGTVFPQYGGGRSFKTIDGERDRVKVNFLIFYEIDQQTE